MVRWFDGSMAQWFNGSIVKMVAVVQLVEVRKGIIAIDERV
jgi:hypothetical protein